MARVERWAPWFAAAVLVAGIAAYAVAKLSDSQAAPAPAHHAAPLTQVERAVVREFVSTAVARKQLGRAWQIAAPELKQGMSLAEWKTGTIPVVPYPVSQAVARLRVVDSFTDTAQVAIDFLPRSGTTAQAATFRLGLRKVGGAWLVSSWAPSSSVAPPKGK
jgi:hypothetical protein